MMACLGSPNYFPNLLWHHLSPEQIDYDQQCCQMLPNRIEGFGISLLHLSTDGTGPCRRL